MLLRLISRARIAAEAPAQIMESQGTCRELIWAYRIHNENQKHLLRMGRYDQQHEAPTRGDRGPWNTRKEHLLPEEGD
jgi:hypothetical protein